MNKILLHSCTLFFAFLYFSCSSSQQAVEDVGEIKGPPKAITSQFKMLSVNTLHGLKDKTDVQKFAAWIKSTGAELVAVQQIERATDSKPGFDAYSELLKRLDMRGTFAKARYYQGWDSGNALFCMYPLLQSDVFVLPSGKGKVRRALSFGIFEMGLKPMAFASTDLDDEDLSERVKQVYEIFSIQKRIPEYPILIAGNFGESSKGKASAKMLEDYICVNSSNDQTVGIDQHIYFPKDGKMNVISSEKVKYNGLNTTGIVATIEVTQ